MKGKKKRKQRSTQTLRERGQETEDEKDRGRNGKIENGLEKEMEKRRLFWGAVGCETGPFTLI